MPDGSVRDRGERAAAMAQHELARRIWWGTHQAQIRLADIAPTLGLTYDTLMRLLRGQTAMMLWHQETLLIRFPGAQQ